MLIWLDKIYKTVDILYSFVYVCPLMNFQNNSSIDEWFSERFLRIDT